MPEGASQMNDGMSSCGVATVPNNYSRACISPVEATSVGCRRALVGQDSPVVLVAIFEPAVRR